MNIDEKYVYDLFLAQNKKCALSGWEIDFNKKSNKNTASIDRIDSTQGYIKGNIQLTHKLVNRCKLNCPEDLFYDICKSIYLNKKSQYESDIEWEFDILNDSERPVLIKRNHIRDNLMVNLGNCSIITEELAVNNEDEVVQES